MADTTFKKPFSFLGTELRISEKLKNFRYQRFFEFLLRSVKKAVSEKNLRKLELLEKLCEELEKEDDSKLPLMNYFLRNEGEVLRFAGYIAEEKREGMILAGNIAKWINNPAVQSFRNRETLYESFQVNRDDFGNIWYRRWQSLKDENEYLMIIQQIMNHSGSKKMMWNAPGLFKRRPRLGYLRRKGRQRPIIAIVDERGFIERTEALSLIWQDILRNKYMMDNFYKIDDFSDEFLMPGRGFKDRI